MAPSNDPNIPKLLKALAAAAKASNTLPLHSSKNQDNQNNSDDDDDDEDEFAYQWTFPEFSSKLCEARTTVLSILGECLSIQNDHFDKNALQQINVEFDWDDQEAIVSSDGNVSINVWNECFDCQESLLEEVERYLLDEHRKNESKSVSNIASTLSSWKSKSGDRGLNRVISNTVDMEKPQIKYEFEFDNSRTAVWVPPYVHERSLPTLKEGHGILYRNKNKIPDSSTAVIAPNMHYPHPFQDVIETFKYTPEQLILSKQNSSSSTLMKPMKPDETCHFIDTEKKIAELSKLMERLKMNLMAVDLEHHSYRSFHGFTCLMQISFRLPMEKGLSTTQTYLIDTIKLRPYIHKYLSSFFQSSTVVKIMHGANSDVQWLQRDFGIYIVNLFDTSIASRLLKLPSAALAYLLKKYAGLTEIDVWKSKYQLGDWRVRPLEEGMRLYAMGDTHYLLDIYDALRDELVKKGGSGETNGDTIKEEDNDQQPRLISIRSVLDSSRKVCLIRYIKDPFYPNGYQRLLSNRRSSKTSKVQSRLTSVQTTILEKLWDWRDAMARELDESIIYICNDRALMRISMAMPHSVSILQGLWNPMPLAIMRCAQQILDIVKNAKNDNNSIAKIDESSRAKNSAFISKDTKSDKKTVNVHTSYLIFEDIEEMEKEADMKVLDINSLNKDYSSFRYMHHSLEMGDVTIADTNELTKDIQGRSKTVDGLGAARVSLQKQDNSVDDEVKQAQISARKVCHNLAVIKRWNHDAWMRSDELKKDKSDGERNAEMDAKTDDMKAEEEIQSLRERYGNMNKKRKDSPSKDTYKESNRTKTVKKEQGSKASKKETLKPFDYSKTNVFSLLDPSLSNAESNNPFFSGAAVNLGSISGLASTNQQSKKKRKKENDNSNGKVKSPIVERPKRRDPNKMHVYKP